MVELQGVTMKNVKKKTRHRDFEEYLSEKLQDPELALGYLNEALMDEDQRVFLLALKDVLTAQGEDIASLAQEAHLTRQNIYRMLSKTGNPRWTSLTSLLNALGLQVHLTGNKQKSFPELLNLDKKLQKSLAREAAKQGISLNTLINEKLSK